MARRLLALSLRISREIELPRVLDEVIDTAIELAHAERGFLLLRQADSLLAPVVARNFPASSSGGAADQISRSIAERAAQSGEPVLTIDAGQDARFDSASSVAALRLRSVLAVPLRVRGAAIGCIYVDHRLRRGAFDDDAAAVLTELADIAAIAIANAQLTAELRQRNQEIDRLNHALAAELAERDAELVRVRAAEGHGSEITRSASGSLLGRDGALISAASELPPIHSVTRYGARAGSSPKGASRRPTSSTRGSAGCRRRRSCRSSLHSMASWAVERWTLTATIAPVRSSCARTTTPKLPRPTSSLTRSST